MDHIPDQSSRSTRVRRMLTGLFDVHSTGTLVVVGVSALLLAAVLGYVTFRDGLGSAAEQPAAGTPWPAPPSEADPGDPDPDESEPGEPGPSASEVETTRVVSRKGGFSLAAPTVLEVTKEGRTVQLTAEDQSLVVNVGPGEAGSLRKADRLFVDTLRTTYRRVRLSGSEAMQVDDLPALTTAGQATNANGVRIRFVVLTVRAKPGNYTIAAYAARDSDPSVVLPLVNAVANGFEVLPPAKKR